MSLDIAVIILLSIYVALMRRYLFPTRWRRQGGKPRYEKAYANLGVPIEAQPAPYPYAAQRPAPYEAAQFAMPRYDFPIIAEEDEEDEEQEETAQQHATPEKQPAEAKAVSPERQEGATGDSGAKRDRHPPAKVQTAGSAPDRVRHQAAAGKPQQQPKLQVRPRPQVQPPPPAQAKAQQPKPTAHVRPQAQAQPKPAAQVKPQAQAQPKSKPQVQANRPSQTAPRAAPITQVRPKPLPAPAKPQPRPVRPAAPAARTPSSAAPAKAAPVKGHARPRHVKWQSKKGRPFTKPAPKPVRTAPQPARPAPQPAKPAPVAKGGPLPKKAVMPPKKAAPPSRKAAPPQPMPARSATAPVKPARPAPAAPAQPGGGRGVDRRKALDLAGAVVAAITRGAHGEVYRRMGRTYREAVSEEVLGAMIEQMNAAYGGARAQTPAGSEVVSGARPGGAGNAGLTFRYSVRTGNGPRPFFVQIVREGDTLVCADFFYG